MDNISLKERRVHTRVSLGIEIEVSLVPGEESDAELSPLLCHCRDISGGGVSFYADKKYRAESLVRMCIPLHGSTLPVQEEEQNMLKAMGTVMWCKKNGSAATYVVGVQFLNIYEQDFQMLHDYMQRLLGE